MICVNINKFKALFSAMDAVFRFIATMVHSESGGFPVPDTNCVILYEPKSMAAVVLLSGVAFPMRAFED